MAEASALQLEAVIGFGGSVPGGLIYHPNGEHIIYPLGSTVVIKNVAENTQVFLQGHSNKVSCITLSKSGNYIASGQQTYMGFKADVIVWDFNEAISGSGNELKYRLKLHRVKIQALAFSPEENFLATLGGQDDNNLVLWDVATGEALCGTPAANDSALTLAYFNNSETRLITAGRYHMRVWDVDLQARKLVSLDADLGQLKRVFRCVHVSPDDSKAYCGTMTGDLLEIKLDSAKPVFRKASRDRHSQGILSVTSFGTEVIIGNGDGSIVKLDSRTKALRVVAKAQVMGAVTSLALNVVDGRCNSMYVGTSQSNIYLVDLNTMSTELRGTCHFDRINDVCFPKDFHKVFVTCSVNDIRVWNALRRQELLRIQVPNLECNCVCITNDGQTILSGWADGKIRAFFPESGKLKFVINDAHDSVTAISVTNDCARIISGGSEGQVRMWDMHTRNMLASLKEHKSSVTSISVRAGDEECISSSHDGSCIVWDLRRYTRNNAMFNSTMFKATLYHPDESQILTGGSDRKLTYWDSYDGNAIRIIEGSNDEINSLDISATGHVFVSAGEDKLLKLWTYDHGECVAIGEGHSGGINAVRISPDGKQIVSVGSEGAIFVWSMPEVDDE
jgi:WD40 repeat protein